MPPNCAQFQNSCAQFRTVARNSAQLRAIPHSCPQFRLKSKNKKTATGNPERNSAQCPTIFAQFENSCAQFCTVARNSAQLLAILHSCPQFCTVGCNSAQLPAILHISAQFREPEFRLETLPCIL